MHAQPCAHTPAHLLQRRLCIAPSWAQVLRFGRWVRVPAGKEIMSGSDAHLVRLCLTGSIAANSGSGCWAPRPLMPGGATSTGAWCVAPLLPDLQAPSALSRPQRFYVLVEGLAALRDVYRGTATKPRTQFSGCCFSFQARQGAARDPLQLLPLLRSARGFQKTGFVTHGGRSCCCPRAPTLARLVSIDGSGAHLNSTYQPAHLGTPPAADVHLWHLHRI